MPTYTYRCGSCGSFDLTRSIAERADPAPCPQCHRIGSRVFTTPNLSTLNPALDRAVTNAGLSAETPQVTQSLPKNAGRKPARAARPGYPPLPTW